MDNAPIRRELSAGEQIVWSGRPRQGVRATFEQRGCAQFVVIAFLLFWLLAVASLTLRHLWDDEGHFDPGALLGGFVMVTVGSACLAFAVGYDAVDRAHTFYGLTNRRIILITGILRPSVWSYPLHQLQRIEVEVQDDGHGTILFKDVPYTRWDDPVVPSFTKIENAQHIHDLVLRAMELPHEGSTDGS